MSKMLGQRICATKPLFHAMPVSLADMVPTPMSPVPMVCEDLRQPDEGPEESQRMSRRKFLRRQHDVIHSLVGNLR